MGEEQGLSAENRATLERVFGIDWTALAIDWRFLNRLLDAARAEGLQPPVVEVDEKVFSSLGASKAPSCVSAGVAENLHETAVAKLFDKTGRAIVVGDIIKVFHFVGARNKRHYMYKQVIGIFSPGRSSDTYVKLSHLDMDDSRRGYYLERLDGRCLGDHEIVQSIDARFEDREREGAPPTDCQTPKGEA